MLRRTFTTTILASTMLPAAASATAPASGKGPRPLSVMTFNIHHGAGTDEKLSLRRIATVIRRSGAGVIGLQEVDKHYSERSDWADQPAELAELLGYHVVFGANIDEEPPEGSDRRVQYGTAILSRHPITDWENTPLPSSADEEPRGLLRAEIDVHGRGIQFCSTHLAAASETDRRDQVEQIIDLIGDEGPAVIVGDMNAEPDAPEIIRMEEVYTDAWSAAGRGDGSTFPAEEPDKRIDNIYLTDAVKPIRTRVRDRAPEASDHLPVVSRVLVKA